MQSILKYLTLSFAILLLSGCATQAPKKDYSAFKQEELQSILIVPVVNQSVDVDAPSYFLSTISVPVAEKGYYVFPVNTVKTVLESEGLYEPALIHQADPVKLGDMFGADSILYVTINKWTAEYVVISTTVSVDFTYRLVSARSGEELWSTQQSMQYSPQNSSNSSGDPLADLVAAVVSAALTKAAPNYMPLTQQANQQVFHLSPNQIPDGPYRIPNTEE